MCSSDLGLSCGGTIAVAVYALDHAILEQVITAAATDTPVALTVRLAAERFGEQRLVSAASEPGDDAVAAAARASPSGVNSITISGLAVPSVKSRRVESTVEIPSGGSLAMAGLIQEQTKQAINGLPGMTQLPVLGTLFRSRDYINRQTELMVLVTPYIVRAVAQKDLSRPDDGFADAGDRRVGGERRALLTHGTACRAGGARVGQSQAADLHVEPHR